MKTEAEVKAILKSLKTDLKKTTKAFERDDNIDDMHLMESLDAQIEIVNLILA